MRYNLNACFCLSLVLFLAMDRGAGDHLKRRGSFSIPKRPLIRSGSRWSSSHALASNVRSKAHVPFAEPAPSVAANSERGESDTNNLSSIRPSMFSDQSKEFVPSAQGLLYLRAWGKCPLNGHAPERIGHNCQNRGTCIKYC